MAQGNFSPIKIAVDSLLDNKYFNYSYKTAIEAEIATVSISPNESVPIPIPLNADDDIAVALTRDQRHNFQHL